VTDSITRKTEGINGRTGKEIEDKVAKPAKVNDTTDQIASTTKTYRDTLLSPNQASLSEPCSTSNSWTTPRDFEVSESQCLVQRFPTESTSAPHSKSMSNVSEGVGCSPCALLCLMVSGYLHT
jgi:hypothetical protein